MNLSSLWQRILAAPQDEDLKAQYVQAAARTGDSRAEIFRLAAELRRFPVYYVQHEPLSREYENSLSVWREEFDAAARKWNAEIKFVEGWPIEITLDAAGFCRHAAEIVAMLPLRHLNLRAVRAAPEVFSVAQLSQVGSMTGSDQPWSSEAILALSTSSHLESLRWLDLSSTGISDAEIEVLASSAYLRELVYLDLRDNPGRDPVDAAAGYGVDGITGTIVSESIWLPDFGRELEARYGPIGWLHSLWRYMESHPPNRYAF